MSRAEWISTLRGLAALLVFISHLKIDVSSEFLFIIGRVGVVLFFLMTGYLTYSSRTRRNTKQYAFNRFIRMYPVYWALLIIGYPILALTGVSFVGFLLNFTLFEEFLGVDTVLGASWMMPIQVCFFVIAAVLGVKCFSKKGSTSMIILMCMVAIISGVLWNITGKPFPTAFPLLIMVAFLSVSYYQYSRGIVELKTIILQLLIFEVGLVIGVHLSYDNWLSYLIAYNIGGVMFILAS